MPDDEDRQLQWLIEDKREFVFAGLQVFTDVGNGKINGLHIAEGIKGRSRRISHCGMVKTAETAARLILKIRSVVVFLVLQR